LSLPLRRCLKKIPAEEQALKHERHCHGRHDIPRFKQTKERGNRLELQTCNHRSGGRDFIAAMIPYAYKPRCSTPDCTPEAPYFGERGSR
jgi:hypothetical protein